MTASVFVAASLDAGVQYDMARTPERAGGMSEHRGRRAPLRNEEQGRECERGTQTCTKEVPLALAPGATERINIHPSRGQLPRRQRRT